MTEPNKDGQVDAGQPKVVGLVASRPRKYNYRCVGCGRLLFRGYIETGSNIQCRCPRCGTMWSTAPLSPAAGLVE